MTPTRTISDPLAWFFAGPPAGPSLFREVVRRLGQGEARPLLDPARAAEGWSEVGTRIAALVEACPAPVVLVAHGLAVPAIVAAALRCTPRALVLSNGPIRQLDPVTRHLSRLAALGTPVTESLFRPTFWLRALSSSAALRRTVVNPYVMEPATVGLLCGPLVADRQSRRAMGAYLASLGRGLPDSRALSVPTLLLWGDADSLYPTSEADHFAASRGGARRVDLPGGRHFHPEERPWALADAVRHLLVEGMGQDATTMS